MSQKIKLTPLNHALEIENNASRHWLGIESTNTDTIVKINHFHYFYRLNISEINNVISCLAHMKQINAKFPTLIIIFQDFHTLFKVRTLPWDYIVNLLSNKPKFKKIE